MRIKNFEIRDLNTIVELAFEKNSIPETNSAFCCKTKKSILEDFTYLIENGKTIVCAEENNNLLGFMAFYEDTDKKSVDCCGPFIADGNYSKVSMAMLEFAKTIFSSDVHYNFYFDRRNNQCFKLMQDINAKDNGNEYVLRLSRNNYKQMIPENNNIINQIEILSASRYQEFEELHNKVHPNIYASGAEIIKTIDNNRIVYSLIVDDKLIASGVLKAYSNSNRLDVEIITVEENYRGKGYGRAILNKLIQVAFETPGIDSVELIVDNINIKARNLYSSVGFEIKIENCSFRLN